jgi:acid phosphatase type 7
LPARPLATALATLLTAALIAACSDAPASAQRSAAPTGTPSATSPGSTDGSSVPRVAGVKGKRVEVVAVGDIACYPGAPVTANTCRHVATADLTKRIDPKAVLGLGDLQYEIGSLDAFEKVYDKSWGDLKSITYPTPGNHEYRTKGAAGYYEYFAGRTPASPGYYAFDLGRWRAYSVNGNCNAIDCDRQARWLRKDLKDNPTECSLIATHFPRYSSGNHGANGFMKRFFRIANNHGVDLMLAGHDHHYERFKRMNHKGDVVKRGVMQFVSGAGGKVHYSADGRATGSKYVDDDTYGVLRLVLRPKSFRYGFRGIDGSRQDNGTRSCV